MQFLYCGHISIRSHTVVSVTRGCCALVRSHHSCVCVRLTTQWKKRSNVETGTKHCLIFYDTVFVSSFVAASASWFVPTVYYQCDSPDHLRLFQSLFFTLSRFHFDCFVTKFSLFNMLILLFVSLFNCRWMMMRSRVKYLMASIKWILYPNPKCYFYLYYYLFSCNKQPMKRSNKIIDFVLTTIIRYKWRILDGVRARASLLYFHFV